MDAITISNKRGYFFDGYGITDADEIIIGKNEPIKIKSIDYDHNTITLVTSVNWEDKDPVNLPFKGSAPDIGVYDTEGSMEVNTPIVSSTPEPLHANSTVGGVDSTIKNTITPIIFAVFILLFVLLAAVLFYRHNKRK